MGLLSGVMSLLLEKKQPSFLTVNPGSSIVAGESPSLRVPSKPTLFGAKELRPGELADARSETCREVVPPRPVGAQVLLGLTSCVPIPGLLSPSAGHRPVVSDTCCHLPFSLP